MNGPMCAGVRERSARKVSDLEVLLHCAGFEVELLLPLFICYQPSQTP